MAWWSKIKVTVIERKAIFIEIPSGGTTETVPLPYSQRNKKLATIIEGLLYEVREGK